MTTQYPFWRGFSSQERKQQAAWRYEHNVVQGLLRSLRLGSLREALLEEATRADRPWLTFQAFQILLPEFPLVLAAAPLRPLKRWEEIFHKMAIAPLREAFRTRYDARTRDQAEIADQPFGLIFPGPQQRRWLLHQDLPPGWGISGPYVTLPDEGGGPTLSLRPWQSFVALCQSYDWSAVC